MANDKEASASLFREMLHWGIYKRSQGRIARQATFAAALLTVLLGAWSLSQFWASESELWNTGIPAVLAVLGSWFAYRLVNLPRFADFLISVEAEMYKVSWPSRGELFRSALVVMIVIFGLAAVLFAYDFVWGYLLKFVGIKGIAGNG